MNSETRERQISICARYSAAVTESPQWLKVGISRNVRDGILPINGLRLSPEGDTTGWYIWAGDLSDSTDFFIPLHVDHLGEWCTAAIPYLLLPPGWRFQVAPDHEDVWFDADLVRA